ncbi:hypothetical protein AAG906_020239 [Vitis piasezkii]
MEEAKTMKTPMSSSIKLDKDEKGKSINSIMYRGMIESHLSAVKRILRYLKGTTDIGLWYPKGDNFELIGFSDADFAGCKVERKSTSVTCHFLGHSLVSWHSKKQNSTLHIPAYRDQFGQDLGPFAGFGVDFGTFLDFILSCLGSLSLQTSFSSFFALWMVPRRKTAISRAQAKRPVEPSQPEQMEARRKARFGPLCRVSSLERLFRGCANLQTPRGWPSVSSYDLLHLIAMRRTSKRVLPYDRFLTRVFKDVGVDLSRKTNFEAPTSYDTYDEDFEQRGPELDIPPPPQLEGTHFEAIFLEPMMTEPSYTAGPSSQPSFTELPHTEIPSQASHAHDHVPWMDVSAQISSLGTLMEELALVSDTRFYSMEDRIDQYQIDFTSRFEHFQ